MSTSTSTSSLPTSALAGPNDASAPPDRLDSWSDQQLVHWVGDRLSVPREAPADSFILHAPLELAARAALLPFVLPRDRALARRRLVVLADGFEAWGPPMPTARHRDFGSLGEATDHLVAAVGRGDLDDVDAAAEWVGERASGVELRDRLTNFVLPQLGAAAHASIFLYHLPRVAPRREVTGRLLRGLARDLARHPDWRLQWIGEPAGSPAVVGSATPGDVFASVAATPRDHGPDAPFIYPVMSYVDGSGIAARQLEPLANVAPAERIDAGRALLRVAAWSMLLEDDEYSPYGWSHCLTLPQAVLGIIGSAPDALTALRVAGTYVVGFRSAHADLPVDPTAPEDPGVAWPDALDADRATAAAAAWHAPVGDRPALIGELASRASIRHDAHLVKYTLACIDAVADDPAHARLFLAAAASLGAWWIAHGDADDPLG